MLLAMFVVTEADAAAIRAAFEQRGELSAAVELTMPRQGSVPGLSPAGSRWSCRYARSGGPNVTHG